MPTTASNPRPESAAVRWENGELVVTHDVHAPRELVFDAWTRPEHFVHWFGPQGTTIPFCELDARTGGTIHFHHHHADGNDVWVRGVYDDVDAPGRIAFTCWFSDATGARVDRPGFPTEMSLDVTLAETDGGTRVTLRQTGLVRDQGEIQGWMEAMDRLSALVSASDGNTR